MFPACVCIPHSASRSIDEVLAVVSRAKHACFVRDDVTVHLSAGMPYRVPAAPAPPVLMHSSSESTRKFVPVQLFQDLLVGSKRWWMAAASFLIACSFARLFPERVLYRILARSSIIRSANGPLASREIATTNNLSIPHLKDRQQSGCAKLSEYRCYFSPCLCFVSISSGIPATQMPRVRWQCT